jgi:hypothetical protein
MGCDLYDNKMSREQFYFATIFQRHLAAEITWNGPFTTLPHTGIKT